MRPIIGSRPFDYQAWVVIILHLKTINCKARSHNVPRKCTNHISNNTRTFDDSNTTKISKIFVIKETLYLSHFPNWLFRVFFEIVIAVFSNRFEGSTLVCVSSRGANFLSHTRASFSSYSNWVGLKQMSCFQGKWTASGSSATIEESKEDMRRV